MSNEIKLVKLGNLCSFENGDRGKNYPSSKDFVANGIPFINGTAIGNGQIIQDELNFITERKYLSLRAGKVNKGDILWSIRGSFGKCAFSPYDKAAIASALVIVRPNEKVDPRYLLHIMNSPYFTKQCKNADNGSIQANLSVETAKDLIIPLPELSVQRTISNILTIFDSILSNNNAICTDLEAMAKLLYDYWFVQFDFPDENGKPYKSSGGKMIWCDELKREIPAAWETWKLGDHMHSLRGVSYSTPDLFGDGIPMINLASFSPDDTYKVSGIKNYSGQYEQAKVLHPNDLIMCNTQQTALDPKKDIIGHCMLVPDIFDGDFVSSHHVNHLIFDTEDLNFLVAGESKQRWFKKYMAGLSSGTNILGMNFEGVYKYSMVLPSKPILRKYASIIKNIEAQKSCIIKENQQLISMRDFLLPMLMNGQVKIKS